MKLLLDFRQLRAALCAGYSGRLIVKNSVKIFKISENKNPYVTKSPNDAKVERKGNEVHVYMTMIRSHFNPDNIEA